MKKSIGLAAIALMAITGNANITINGVDEDTIAIGVMVATQANTNAVLQTQVDSKLPITNGVAVGTLTVQGNLNVTGTEVVSNIYVTNLWVTQTGTAFNVTGNGTVGGSLVVSNTITSPTITAVTDATNALNFVKLSRTGDVGTGTWYGTHIGDGSGITNLPLQTILNSGSVATNVGLALGSTNLTIGKVYIAGEAGAYAVKPLLVLDRSATATGVVISVRSNGTEVASVDKNGNFVGNSSLMSGYPSGAVASTNPLLFTAAEKLIATNLVTFSSGSNIAVRSQGTPTATNIIIDVAYNDLGYPIGTNGDCRLFYTTNNTAAIQYYNGGVWSNATEFSR